jgi:transcriptional regulator with XRE-family HTH domain
MRGRFWLSERRRALGLTVEVLGAAIGVAASTIVAVESGDHDLTPRLRARAEAYFAEELLRRLHPPDNLVHAEIWVNPETLAAARREAKRRGTTLGRVLGEWADRPR